MIGTVEHYSLIVIYKESGDMVDGTWIQNFTGTLAEASRAARETEKANSDRIKVAVVDSVNSCCPDYNPRKNLKRLDKGSDIFDV